MLKRIALLVVTALFPMIALGQGLSDNEMFEIMRESAGPKVTDQQIENVISAVRNAGAVVEGVVSYQAWDAAFFYDTDVHDIAVTYVDQETGRLTTNDTTYQVTVREGGFVTGLAYKWNWIFFTTPIEVEDLSTLTLGRGLGLSVSPSAISGTIQFASGANTTAIIASVSLGLGEAGLRFPKLEFSMRDEVKELAKPLKDQN